MVSESYLFVVLNFALPGLVLGLLLGVLDLQLSNCELVTSRLKTLSSCNETCIYCSISLTTITFRAEDC